MPPGHDVILDDGHGRLCGGAARQPQWLPCGTGARLRSFREDGGLASFPGVTADRCERVLSDGAVVEGLEAVVLGRRPPGWLLRVYDVPGLRQSLDALYRGVARQRSRIAGRACPDGACTLHFK